jgi:hypothetical protein
MMERTGVPPELNSAYRALTEAFNLLVPHVAAMLTKQDPEASDQIAQHIESGNSGLRCVFVPKQGLLQFEILDADGAWMPFYRLVGGSPGTSH